MTVVPIWQPSTIPLALRRVYLRSVGHPDARCDPLMLDLTTATGMPSDRALLQLVNTGGKTTILRLLTSLIVPNDRQQMGGLNIVDYVLTGDTVHVVTEWAVEGAPAFVVGGCYEWPGRRAETSISRLRRYWYTFQTGNGVELDDIPLDETDGRRRTQESFRKALSNLFSSHPAARFVHVTDNQAEWNQTLLSNTPLDPELFRYQMRMNDDESGAQALVKEMKTDDDVVRFFINTLSNTDTADALFRNVTAYASKIAQRDDFVAELDLANALVPALDLLAAAVGRHSDAGRRLEMAQLGIAELAGSFAARAHQEAAEHERLTGDAEQQDAQHRASQNQDNYLDRVLATLQLEAARYTLEAAQAAHVAATAKLAEVGHEIAVWDAARLVHEANLAEAAAAAAQAAYAAAEAGLEPLRQRSRAAAGSLVSALTVRSEAALAAAATAKHNGAEAERAVQQARELRAKASKVIAEADADLRRGKELLAAARTARLAAVDAGAMGQGETIAEARHRVDAAVDASTAEVIERINAAAVARTAVDAAQAALQDATGVLHQAEAAETTATGALDRHAGDLSMLNRDALIEARGGVDGPDSAGRAAASLREDAATAERAAAEAETRLVLLGEQIKHFDRDGVRGGSQDTDAVRGVLLERGIGALSGWQWLAENVSDTDKRRTMLVAAPGLAGGVVILDPSRCDEAHAALRAANLDLQGAVTVGVASGFDRPGSSAEGSFVVAPGLATYDPAGAARLAEELARTREEVAVALDERRRGAETARKSISQLDAYVERWPANVVTDGRRVAAETRQATDRARHAKSDAASTVQRAREQQESAATAQSAAQDARNALQQLLVPLDRAEQADNAAAAATARHHELLAARARAEAQLEEASTAEADADARRINAATAQAEAHKDHDTFAQRAAAVGVAPGPFDADQDLTALEANHAALRRELDAAEAGSSHAADLDRANATAAAALEAISAVDPDVIVDARLAAQDDQDVSVATAWRRRRDALAAAHTAAVRAESETGVRLGDAEAEYERRGVIARPRGLVELVADLAVTGPEDVRAAIERVQAKQDRIREETARLSAKLADTRRCALNAQTSHQQFETLTAAAGIDALPGQPAWDGTYDVAASANRSRLDERDAARDEKERTADAQSGAIAAARTIAMDKRWPETAYRTKINAASDGEVAINAADLSLEIVNRAIGLESDLNAIDDNRRMVVNETRNIVDTNLKTLRDVSRESRIPDGFGDLSGQPAILIRFDPLPAVETAAVLGERIDSWARSIAGGSAPDEKRRAHWITDACRDCVRRPASGSAWRVDVLKPSIDGRYRMCPPDQITNGYSGGQELTLAVLLYITLAAVRAISRSTTQRPPGVLLLDNPFGFASHPALIVLQQGLASARGIQVVCTSGTQDLGVLTTFDGPEARIISLRNDAAIGRAVNHLRATAPSLAGTLDGLVAPRTPEAIDAKVEGILDATAYSTPAAADTKR